MTASLIVGSLTFVSAAYNFDKLPIISNPIAYAVVKEYIGVSEAVMKDNETVEAVKKRAEDFAIFNATEKAQADLRIYNFDFKVIDTKYKKIKKKVNGKSVIVYQATVKIRVDTDKHN